MSEFWIRFEAWSKLAEQWLVCVPLGIHLESINRINAVSDNVIIINCAIWPKERTVQCQIRSSLQPMVCHVSLSKTLLHVDTCSRYMYMYM